MKKRLVLILAMALLLAGLCAPEAQAETMSWEGWTPISTQAELRAIENDMDGKYYLTNNITLSGNWAPIVSDSTYAFSGMLDGNGYTISNLKLDFDGGTTAGLFYAVEGTVRNLTVSLNTNLTGETGTWGYYVGAIAGSLYSNSQVYNCHAKGTLNITINDTILNVGGLVGASSSLSFDHCTSDVDITVTSTNVDTNYGDVVYIGGIAGTTYKEVAYCTNSGNLTCHGSNVYMGGITGLHNANSYGPIEVCSNSGTLRSTTELDLSYTEHYVGGIVGRLENTDSYCRLYRCFNTGAVTGESTYWLYVGGLAGQSSENIEQCYNAGTVTAVNRKKYSSSDYGQITVGGIVGDAMWEAPAITDCYNSGTVSYKAYNNSSTYKHQCPYIGGIAGLAYNNVFTRCFHAGTITKGSSYSWWAGGIVGYDWGGSSSNTSLNACTYTDVYWYKYGNYCKALYQNKQGTTAVTTGAVTSLSDFASKSLYTNYNFSSVWTMGTDTALLRNARVHTHSLSSYSDLAPTCTATGHVQYWMCSGCWSTFRDAGFNQVRMADVNIPATGHTLVVDEAVAPTCTATGLKEGKHCSVCGKVTVAQTEVAATGHTEVTDPAVAPTRTQTGLTEGSHCSVCNTVLVAQEVVPATGVHGSHPECAETCAHETTHESITFNKWTYGTFSSGNYYMSGDMTLPKGLTITGNAHLCLDGHTLTIADGYSLCVEQGASLTICDCTGGGIITRTEDQGNGDSSLVVNRGTMTIYGGSFAPNGRGVNLHNTGDLTIYGGIFGFQVSNYYDNWSSSSTIYGNTTIYDASFDTRAADIAAIHNYEGCELTIYDCDILSGKYALQNYGTADIQGGTYRCEGKNVSGYAAILNYGSMDIRNAEVSSLYGNGITNEYNNGRLWIYSGTTVTSEAENRAAVYNRGSLYVRGGTLSGYMGIENESALAGSTSNGGTCTISGGTITGTDCAIRNSGNTSTTYSNGVATGKKFSRAILNISGTPTIGKIVLEYPESLTFTYTGTTPIELEVELDDIAVGDTIWSGNTNKLPLTPLVNEGYVLLYDYSKDIYLASSHCGATTSDEVYWKLSPEGELTISGTGDMDDFGFSTYQPWNENKTKVAVTEVTIESGVTSIGGSAFAYMEGLTEITIPEGVTRIGSFAFEGCENLEEVWLPSTLESIETSIFLNAVPETIHYAGCAHQWDAVEKSSQGSAFTPICLPNENTDDGDCTTELLCSVCGGVDVAAQAAHTGGTATCTALAECEVCGTAYGDYGHIEVTDAAVEPTCTVTGLTEGKHCSECGETLVAQEEVAALGHTEVTDAAVAPTCTETGLTEGKHCSECGDILVAQTEVAATGHAEVTDAAVEPTCTATGLTEGKHCSECGETLTAQEIVPVKGHSYKAVVTAPTCTADGYTTHTCSVCGDSYTDTPVPAAHTPADAVSENEISATCTADGSYEAVVYCEVCGEELSRTDKGIPATGHSYQSTVTAPTCSLQGYTTHVCGVCGGSYVGNYTDALGHTEATDAAVSATCTTTGLTEGSHCSVCDKVFTAQEVTPALGHDWNEGEQTLAPTEQSTGLMTYTCQRCSQEKTEILPALEHVHKYEPAVTNPTCTAQGYTTWTCRCGDSYVDDMTGLLSHTEVIDPAVSNTCTEAGLTEGSHCSVCGEITKPQYELAPTGHSWNDGEIILEPTEESEGIQVFTCVSCGETLEKTLPTVEHVHKHEATVTAPTCTAQGYTTYTCRCGDSYVADYTEAAGHLEIGIPAKPATCTEAGLTEALYCQTCGEVFQAQEVIPASGHSWNEGIVTTAPTEFSAGLMTYTCTACQETKTEEIPALEHVHKHESTVTAPTCEEQGYTTYTCRCGDSYMDDFVDMLGHSFSRWMPTANGNEESRSCSVCGTTETRVTPDLQCVIMDAADLGENPSVWINGEECGVQILGDKAAVSLPEGDRFYMQTYTFYVGDANDIHTHYPITMQVWYVEKDENGVFTATHIEELDNLLQYAGSSIRIVGVKGIRMITAMDKAAKNALVSANGLAGFRLLEYGTVLSWASDLGDHNPLILGPEYAKSNYAYKRGVADPVFAQTADKIQYTNVLVGFDNDQCIPDIAMRSYIILEDENGGEVTLYGGTVYRSIGYIAWQNRAAFQPGTAAYEYVWEIIHHVYGDKYDDEYTG